MRLTAGLRTNIVWMMLSAVTVVSWGLASLRGRSEFSASTAVTVAVLLIAAFKVRLIIQEFMEVRFGPSWLRRLTDGWLAALLAAVLVLYLA